MYFAISGKNGVAVMDTLAGAEKLRRYIREAQILEFSQFEAAEFWALATFRERSPVGKSLTYLQVNHAIFNRDILSGKTTRRRLCE